MSSEASFWRVIRDNWPIVLFVIGLILATGEARFQLFTLSKTLDKLETSLANRDVDRNQWQRISKIDNELAMLQGSLSIWTETMEKALDRYEKRLDRFEQ